MTKLRLAIVGAGPAGIYAADILLKAERSSTSRSTCSSSCPRRTAWCATASRPTTRASRASSPRCATCSTAATSASSATCASARDITLDDLKKHYNAVIFSTGAVRDADLDIPGIDLPGSYGAADFVSWYDGHPDCPARVAARGRSRSPSSATATSRSTSRACSPSTPTTCCRPRSPPTSTTGLKASPVTDVHVFGRRGPAQVKFTPLELRELGELRDVDMIVYDEDFDYDEASQAAIDDATSRSS